MLIMFRKDRFQLVGIEGGVGLGLLPDDLQLRGVGVEEVDHSGRAGFILVDSSEHGRERVRVPQWAAALYIAICQITSSTGA